MLEGETRPPSLEEAEDTVAEVAANHGVSPAQVLIRWHLQSGNVCIPGSSNPDHICEDADVFGFDLTADEMAARRNTINYEVVCNFSQRLDRVFV